MSGVSGLDNVTLRYMSRPTSTIFVTIAISNCLIIWWILYRIITKLSCASSVTVNKDNVQTTISFSRFTRYASSISICFYCISHISTFIFAVINLYLIDECSGLCNTLRKTSFVSWFLMWFLGRWTMCAVFVAQLKVSFKDTIYSYNAHTFRCLHSMLYLYLLPLLILTVVHIFVESVSISSHVIDKLNMIWGLSMGILNLFDITFSIILLYLFQKKLVELIQSYFIAINKYKKKQEMEIVAEKHLDVILIPDSMEDRTHTLVSLQSISGSGDKLCNKKVKTSYRIYRGMIGDSIDGRHYDVDIVGTKKSEYEKKIKEYDEEFGFRKCELINAMTQYTILIILVLLPQSCLCIIGLLHSAVFNSMETGHIIWFFINVNACINALCLYLNFPFSLKLYRFLCIYPHKYLAFLCGKRVDRALENGEQ